MTKNATSTLQKVSTSLQLSILFLCFSTTVVAQLPVINSFEPTFATKGDQVIIRGNRLNNATEVKFGNVSADSFQILVDTAFYIRAFVGAGASGSVSVTNPNGTGSKTGFTFYSTAPVISSFFPTSAAKGSAVYINGNFLNNTTAVSFGGVAADSFKVLVDTAYYLEVFVGSGASGNISVTNPSGTATITGFTFIGADPPVISSFLPNSAAAGAAVKIRGTNISAATAVSFGGVSARSFQVLLDSTFYISAIVDTGSTGVVSVTTPSGTVTKTGFTFIAGNPPVINSFFPISAAAGAAIKIRGTNLSGATAVSFGGVSARSFQVLSDSTVYISAIVDTGSTGSVLVTTPAGTATKTGFTFIAATLPLITGFTPTSGIAGTTVKIRGTNLNNVTAVSFGGMPANSFNILIDTAFYINAVVGSGSSGNITVTKSNGTSVSADVFTVITGGINDTISLCPNGSVSIVSNLTGNTYQWQINSDTGYANLTNVGFFSGVNSKSLHISNIPDSYSGRRFRCVVNGNTVSKITTVIFAIIWTGNSNNNWENSQNWGCGAKVPDANTDVVITNGTVLLNNPTTVKSIRVSPGANLVVAPGVELIIKNK